MSLSDDEDYIDTGFVSKPTRSTQLRKQVLKQSLEECLVKNPGKGKRLMKKNNIKSFVNQNLLGRGQTLSESEDDADINMPFEPNTQNKLSESNSESQNAENNSKNEKLDDSSDEEIISPKRLRRQVPVISDDTDSNSDSDQSAKNRLKPDFKNPSSSVSKIRTRRSTGCDLNSQGQASSSRRLTRSMSSPVKVDKLPRVTRRRKSDRLSSSSDQNSPVSNNATTNLSDRLTGHTCNSSSTSGDMMSGHNSDIKPAVKSSRLLERITRNRHAQDKKDTIRSKANSSVDDVFHRANTRMKLPTGSKNKSSNSVSIAQNEKENVLPGSKTCESTDSHSKSTTLVQVDEDISIKIDTNLVEDTVEMFPNSPASLDSVENINPVSDKNEVSEPLHTEDNESLEMPVLAREVIDSKKHEFVADSESSLDTPSVIFTPLAETETKDSVDSKSPEIPQDNDGSSVGGGDLTSQGHEGLEDVDENLTSQDNDGLEVVGDAIWSPRRLTRGMVSRHISTGFSLTSLSSMSSLESVTSPTSPVMLKPINQQDSFKAASPDKCKSSPTKTECINSSDKVTFDKMSMDKCDNNSDQQLNLESTDNSIPKESESKLSVTSIKPLAKSDVNGKKSVPTKTKMLTSIMKELGNRSKKLASENQKPTIKTTENDNKSKTNILVNNKKEDVKQNKSAFVVIDKHKVEKPDDTATQSEQVVDVQTCSLDDLPGTSRRRKASVNRQGSGGFTSYDNLVPPYIPQQGSSKDSCFIPIPDNIESHEVASFTGRQSSGSSGKSTPTNSNEVASLTGRLSSECSGKSTPPIKRVARNTPPINREVASLSGRLSSGSSGRSTPPIIRVAKNTAPIRSSVMASSPLSPLIPSPFDFIIPMALSPLPPSPLRDHEPVSPLPRTPSLDLELYPESLSSQIKKLCSDDSTTPVLTPVPSIISTPGSPPAQLLPESEGKSNRPTPCAFHSEVPSSAIHVKPKPTSFPAKQNLTSAFQEVPSQPAKKNTGKRYKSQQCLLNLANVSQKVFIKLIIIVDY